MLLVANQRAVVLFEIVDRVVAVGTAPGSSLARRLALWDLQNDSRAHYDNPNEITPNEITVNPVAPFGVHHLAP
jgi:hypothetical protein